MRVARTDPVALISEVPLDLGIEPEILPEQRVPAPLDELAEKTVKNYVSSLLAKIQVHGRTQAALYIAEAHRAHPTARRAGIPRT